MAKVRVLFILSAVQRNGAVLSTLTTMKHLDRSRFEPALFVLERRDEPWHDLLQGVPITYGVSAGKPKAHHFPQVLAKLLRAARRSDVLVGGVEMAPTFLAIIAAKLTFKPSVGFVRNSLPEHLAQMPARYKLITKLLYPYLSRAIAISEGIKESLTGLVPRLEGRTRTVYIPLDIAKTQERSREALPQADAAEPYIVAVGRLEYQKGFDLLLRAYAQLRDELPHKLVLVGEGKARAKLTAIVQELGLGDRVMMPGFQENPYAWMKGAALFVSSSRYEGFCRVIAEALAVGTPVVATDCPSGPAEVLAGGRYGVLVENENVAALAQGIHTLLCDPERLQTLSELGPRRAEQFSPEATVERFEGVLAEMLRVPQRAS